ncbi:unnamed protein product [Nezara viridula]|uniref:Uncharacterized protein n=1 Tax=Nezara viridula TaxID=85310 RepID=A0A9P0HBX6_NEZVI|nr:unnamed protein product [Nezara viridula]
MWWLSEGDHNRIITSPMNPYSISGAAFFLFGGQGARGFGRGGSPSPSIWILSLTGSHLHEHIKPCISIGDHSGVEATVQTLGVCSVRSSRGPIAVSEVIVQI